MHPPACVFTVVASHSGAGYVELDTVPQELTCLVCSTVYVLEYAST